MARLCEGVGDVELTDTGPFVGDATVLLTRAAIASVGDTSAQRHNAMKEVLYQRVVEYIVQHHVRRRAASTLLRPDGMRAVKRIEL